ncbi:MAG TPA: hypothetical protein VNV25_05790 [Gemmatimonadaceae bacterium]|jgi:hypothetical protein|nr:hypothetical protein [Gemmatimonadaceae bacterium]
MAITSHRLVGILEFRTLLTNELHLREHYDALLADFAAIPTGMPIWGPAMYGSFSATSHLRWRFQRSNGSDDRLVQSLCRRAFRRPLTEAVFVLDTVFVPDSETMAELSPEIGEGGLISLAASMLADTLRSLVYAANIARPATLTSVSVAVAMGDGRQMFERHDLIGDFGAVREYATRTGWPIFDELPILDVWVWTLKNFLPTRCGDSPLSRAFNAHTYLYGVEIPTPLKMLAALIGVEALFGGGSTNQLIERVHLLLGPSKDFRRDLRRMYEIRSAVVHGSAGFPPHLFPYADPPAYAGRRRETDKAADVGSAILLAALQRCAKVGASRLEYEEHLTHHTEDYDQERSDEIGTNFVRYRLSDVQAYETGVRRAMRQRSRKTASRG